MIAQARIVFFMTDPMVGSRIAVGAIIGCGDTAKFAPALKLPQAECLGDPLAVRLLSFVLHRLEAAQLSPDALPGDVGHHFELGDPLTIPARALREGATWVQRHLLPRPVPALKTSQPRPTVRTRRDDAGYNFFRQHKVGHWVHRGFNPNQFTAPWWRKRSALLPTVTHWVRGARTLLLMEPVLCDVQTATLRREARDVSQRLSTYAGHVALPGAPLGVQLIAYVLPGGSDDARSEVLSLLEIGNVPSVFDVATPERRVELLGIVSDAGRSLDLIERE